MHLVFVTSIVPDGAMSTGYEIANAAIVGALRRAGARVTVLGFAWPGSAIADRDDTVVLGEVDVRTDTASAMRKLAWAARALRTGLTIASAKLRVVTSEAVRDAIARIGPFDAYILNSVQMAAAFEGVFLDRPSIFVAHNVEHHAAGENASAAQNLLKRRLYRREARLLADIEQRLCDRARFIFTFAEEDRIALGVASDARSAFLPLTVHDTPPPPMRRDISCDAALIGTWTWEPNRLGLDWFLSQVVPLLRRDFRIRIAGRVAGHAHVGHPGVEFVGRVPHADEFVRSGAVVPLVSVAGSGVQLKSIETFELGLPSVATSRSLRGIAVPPGYCVVADDPRAFALALEKAAAQPRDVDGRTFHDRQLRALDRQVARGMEALGRASSRIAA